MTTKVLAVLGSLALSFTAFINAILATMALLSGHVAGVIGDASEKTQFDQHLTHDAHHIAIVAKLFAIGFGLLGLAEFGAGELLRRCMRHVFVLIACGMTVAGEIAFSVWAKHFTSLDAIMVVCAVFAAWTWYRLPRATPVDARLGTLHSALN